MPYHDLPPSEYQDLSAEPPQIAAAPPPAEGDPPPSSDFSWTTLLPYLASMLQDADPVVRDAGLRDLRQMARAADKYNAMIRVAAAE
jgi:hypothetical protein